LTTFFVIPLLLDLVSPASGYCDSASLIQHAADKIAELDALAWLLSSSSRSVLASAFVRVRSPRIIAWW
jgi:hypothetical protein